MLRDLGAAQVRSRYFLFSPLGGDRIQSIEGRFLARLPLGAQYLVEAVRCQERRTPLPTPSFARASRELQP
jgi:hypothetical protein